MLIPHSTSHREKLVAQCYVFIFFGGVFSEANVMSESLGWIEEGELRGGVAGREDGMYIKVLFVFFLKAKNLQKILVLI